MQWKLHRNRNRHKRAALACALMLAACTGCGRNPYATGYAGAPYANAPYAAQFPGAQYPGAAAGMAGYPPNAQVTELERRVQQLDMDNRQLTTQLAQSQQKWQVSDQRASLFQQQLQDATMQLQQARLAQQDLQGQTRGLQASMSARGGATLRPNTSGPTNTLPGLVGAPGYPAAQGVNPGMNPAINPGASGYGAQPLGSLAGGNGMLGSAIASIQIPGGTVQQEGQVVRIRVPADQLFTPGSAQLNPASFQVLDRVADSVFRFFPRQRVAVEGHTDSGTVSSTGQPNQYQLATAQAQAVMEQLVRRNSIPTRQLTVIAHGPNFPRGDNQSAAGRAENRRIEFVVYPEQY